MYTPEQLARRDRSPWTKVQAMLAPIQFVMFVVSLALVVRYLMTGEGYIITTISILVKIALLWVITITGAFWEKEIFGTWFLAREFFWEDMGNLVAMLAHNAYFVVQGLGLDRQTVMMTMLVAYLTYLVNCTQFVIRGIQAGRTRRQLSAVGRYAVSQEG